ncbi:hypothetical protein [Sphingomonas endophytica]|uniref:Uncharacterized protein n=1 Tax=Sphingomonas endophytica TaxID=869719 RepID=A0A147I3M9_9SPHN|nr:hypothetical protein [Sphingomonas endophytica]KTT72614.1 hypothetical protein NS334_08445 [Sphingomonas endophytica]
MSRPDAAASAALDLQVIRPVFFAYLDILGDPLRACTAGRSLVVQGTGDSELDGFTFDGIDPTVVDIGPVRAKDGGSEAVTAKLSGILTLDAGLLALIGDGATWQGRTARLWRMIRDEDGVQRGAIQSYYTGWMTALSITGDPVGGQTINLTIEAYLAAYSQASNRSYQDQELFDPGDLSARAAIAIANGNSGSPLIDNTRVSFDSPRAMSAHAIRSLF